MSVFKHSRIRLLFVCTENQFESCFQFGSRTFFRELVKDLAGTVDVGVADPEVLGVPSACSDQDIGDATPVPGHSIYYTDQGARRVGLPSAVLENPILK